MRTFIAVLKATFPPNRIVSILAPAIAVAAGVAATWLAEHFPGAPTPGTEELTSLAILGTGAVVVAAYKWIDGWQKHEARQVTDTAALDTSEPEPGDQGAV